MGKSTIKNIVLAVLTVGLVGMTIAYATLTQRLDINSTAKVKGSTWKVLFQNGSQVSTTGAAVVKTNPTLSETLITGLDAEFTKPGDSITYTFDVANTGTIDAILSTYKINTVSDGVSCTSTDQSNGTLVCGNLTYTLTYTADGKAVAQNDTLQAGESKNITLTIAFNESATAVPTDDVTISGLDALFIYEQN